MKKGILFMYYFSEREILTTINSKKKSNRIDYRFAELFAIIIINYEYNTDKYLVRLSVYWNLH